MRCGSDRRPGTRGARPAGDELGEGLVEVLEHSSTPRTSVRGGGGRGGDHEITQLCRPDGVRGGAEPQAGQRTDPVDLGGDTIIG